jgi:AcrR family transcriptional regulator
VSGLSSRSLPLRNRESSAPRAPRTSRGARTRARILAAAERVFGDRGFYGARITEITRLSGVALGTFYVYFSSKDEIFRVLVQTLNHDLRRTLAEGTRGLSSRAEVEARGLALFLKFLQRHRKLYRIVKQAEIIDPPLFRWYYRRIAKGYARGLRSAMERGEIEPRDPELVAYALMGVADFIGMRYVTLNGGLSPKQLHQLSELILHGLLPRSPQGRQDGRAVRRGSSRP